MILVTKFVIVALVFFASLVSLNLVKSLPQSKLPLIADIVTWTVPEPTRTKTRLVRASKPRLMMEQSRERICLSRARLVSHDSVKLVHVPQTMRHDPEVGSKQFLVGLLHFFTRLWKSYLLF